MATVIFTITDEGENNVHMDVSGDPVVDATGELVEGGLTPAQILGQSMLAFAQLVVGQAREVSGVEH